MGILAFFRKVRTIAENLWDNGAGWVRLFGGGGHVDGEPINDKSALTVATYYCCIRNIAQDCGIAPYRSLKNDAQDRKRIRIQDQLDYIFNVAFNPMMTAYQGRCTLQQWVSGWGRAYAEIARNGRLEPMELYPIHPSRVSTEWSQDGKTRTFIVHNDNGVPTRISSRDMFHVYGEGDGYEGYSVVRLMANTLGLALSAQNLAKTFFSRGAMPGGVLETDEVLDETARKNLRDSWQTLYGGPDNAGKTAILEKGLKYKAMTLPFKDVQLLEIRKFQKEEIASWFRMPLNKLQVVGAAKGWATLDATETDYVKSCLLPQFVRFEQEIKRQLMGNEGEYKNAYAHFELKGILRGAMSERMAFYKELFFMGAITPNEIRKLEDMDAIDAPGMDKTYVQGAMVPLELAGMMKGAGVDPTPPTAPTAPKAPEPNDTDDKDGDDGK